MVRINPKGMAAIAAAGLAVASPFLVHFVGKWEGSSEYTVYADQLANKIPTVCKGLTHHVTDTPIIVGEVWSKEKCEAEEKRALVAVQSHLILCFNSRYPPQSVFDMATSHAWNVGYPSTCGSQAMKAWQQGEWELGCRRLHQADSGKLVWAFANGKFVRGLSNRRADERANCTP